MNNQEILARKGAQKGTEIPHDVLALLNAGTIPTVNLTEWLAVDHSQLVKRVFPSMGIDDTMVNQVVEEINRQKKPSTMTRCVAMPVILWLLIPLYPWLIS